jgi:hypothetical protein
MTPRRWVSLAICVGLYIGGVLCVVEGSAVCAAFMLGMGYGLLVSLR